MDKNQIFSELIRLQNETYNLMMEINQIQDTSFRETHSWVIIKLKEAFNIFHGIATAYTN